MTNDTPEAKIESAGWAAVITAHAMRARKTAKEFVANSEAESESAKELYESESK